VIYAVLGLGVNEKQYLVYQETKLGRNSLISSFGNLQVVKGLSFFGFMKNDSLILEVGSGIGTITKALLENYKSKIYCFELNNFCINKLLELKNLTILEHKKEFI
jgi:16S rRNA A1518/A1519 N6-dimethyltransferase RsmA/KsgA/DIM1 with predicted DNA glycosylase/AP lyase activity